MAITTPAPRQRPSWPLIFLAAFLAFRRRDADHKPRQLQAPERRPATRVAGNTSSADRLQPKHRCRSREPGRGRRAEAPWQIPCAHAIRERWPPIELILTSGHFDLSDDEIPEHGRFFPKPYRDQEIISALQHFVA